MQQIAQIKLKEVIIIFKHEREKQLKKEVLDEIFKINKYYELKVDCNESSEGAILDKETDKYYKYFRYINEEDAPQKAHLMNDITVYNAGLSKMIRNKCMIYEGIVSKTEIKSYCIAIILKAINKFKLRDDAIEGKEKDLLFSYILKCIDKQIQNDIDKETGTFKTLNGYNVDVITPSRMMSYDVYVSNESENIDNDETFKDLLLTEQSLFLVKEGYEESESYKSILKALEDKLTDKQKEIFYLMSITIDKDNLDGNRAEVGRMLKQKDITEGRETRSSDEAYRIYVSRQQSKIIKIIEDNINISNITKSSKLKNLKNEIENIVDDPDEGSILKYIVENIDKYYIEDIIYDLHIELRKHLISNFIKEFKEDKINNSETRKVCTYLIKGLYKLIHSLNCEINNINNIDKIDKVKNQDKICKTADKYKYYVMKDKYNELSKNKNISKLGQQEIIVEYTRKYEEYKVERYEIYYLGEFEVEKVETKQNYNNIINQSGFIYKRKCTA